MKKNVKKNVSLFETKKVDGKITRGFRTFDTKKDERTARVETNKSTQAALANYLSWIEQGFNVLCKGDKNARDIASLAKSIYKTPYNIACACYPIQTPDGVLLIVGKNEQGKKVYKEKVLRGAACAASVLRVALRNFVNRGGVTRHAIGDPVPAKGDK